MNMTNGVTPRRWVHCANPPLSAIFTKYLGSHEQLICSSSSFIPFSPQSQTAKVVD